MDSFEDKAVDKEACGTPIHPPMMIADPEDNVTIATPSPGTYGGKPGDNPGFSGRKQEKMIHAHDMMISEIAVTELNDRENIDGDTECVDDVHHKPTLAGHCDRIFALTIGGPGNIYLRHRQPELTEGPGAAC